MGSKRGVTLIEIIIATMILGLISGGVFTAFVFSRRVSWRSESELRVAEFAQNVADRLRTAVTTDTFDGLSLRAGVYATPGWDFDPAVPGRQNPPGNPPVVEEIPALSIPPGLTRFQVSVFVYVEDHITDRDGTNGAQGRDFDGDGAVDLKWTKILVVWAPPEAP